MKKKDAVIPAEKLIKRPHKCDATLVNIDRVIADVERFHRKIRASQERWDRG